jgi:hypothetical protein
MCTSNTASSAASSATATTTATTTTKTTATTTTSTTATTATTATAASAAAFEGGKHYVVAVGSFEGLLRTVRSAKDVLILSQLVNRFVAAEEPVSGGSKESLCHEDVRRACVVRKYYFSKGARLCIRK